jgi:hypothetical protein
MLSAASGATYSVDTSPGLLARHVLEHAVPRLERLADRDDVARQLERDQPSDWPVPAAAWRMRLLPLLLATGGQRQEALVWLSRFESAPAGLDQLVPGYDAFATCFRQKYGDEG